MKRLLEEARDEILRLRQANEVYAAQVHVVNVFAAAFGFKSMERGASVDVAWKLLNEIDDLREKENRQASRKPRPGKPEPE